MNKPNAYCCLCQQEVYVDAPGFCPLCKSQKGIEMKNMELQKYIDDAHDLAGKENNAHQCIMLMDVFLYKMAELLTDDDVTIMTHRFISNIWQARERKG